MRLQRPSRLLVAGATLLAAGSLTTAAGTPAEAASAKAKTIPLTPFVTAINVALDQSELRLNNLGERHGNSWHRPNDSWVDVFGVTRRFTIDEYSFRRKYGLYRHFYYVNDVNMTQADLAISGDRLVLRINFEDAGRELKGLCRRKTKKGYATCPGKNEGDGNTPDVDWTKGPRLDVSWRPVAHAGSIAFRVTKVSVLGDFKLNGVCGSAGECKKILGDWEGKLKASVSDSLTAVMNAPATLNAEAATMRSVLKKVGVTQAVKSVKLVGGKLTVGV
jgi:hypothetical protein